MEFWANGKLVTRADLAFPEARIALYYDGRHHDDASTRLRDTSIDLYLTSINWRPLRYGTNMLSGLVGHLEVVLRERGFAKVDTKRPKSDLGVRTRVSSGLSTFASRCLSTSIRPPPIHLRHDSSEPLVGVRQRRKRHHGLRKRRGGSVHGVEHGHAVETGAGHSGAGGQGSERADLAAVEGAVLVRDGQELLGGKAPHPRACRMRDSIPE